MNSIAPMKPITVMDKHYDFPVGKRPVVQSNQCDSKRFQWISRLDTDQDFQIVSPSYKILTHKEVVDAVEEGVRLSDLPRDYVLTTKLYPTTSQHTNEVIEGGKLFGRVTFPSVKIEPLPRDTITFELLFFNSYDGSYSFQVIGQGKRQICSNGMVGNFNIVRETQKHTKNINTDSVAKHITSSVDIFYNSSDKYLRWSQQTITDEQATEFIKKYITKTNNFDHNTNQFKVNNKQTDLLVKLWIKNKYELGSNCWALYNAITEWASHPEGVDNPITTMRNSMVKVSQSLSAPIFN